MWEPAGSRLTRKQSVASGKHGRHALGEPDSSDEDERMIYTNLGLFPIPRVYRRRRDPFTDLDDEELRARFRLSKDAALRSPASVVRGRFCPPYIFIYIFVAPIFLAYSSLDTTRVLWGTIVNSYNCDKDAQLDQIINREKNCLSIFITCLLLFLNLRHECCFWSQIARELYSLCHMLKPGAREVCRFFLLKL